MWGKKGGEEISCLWGVLLLLNLRFSVIFKDNCETNTWSYTKHDMEELGTEIHFVPFELGCECWEINSRRARVEKLN